MMFEAADEISNSGMLVSYGFLLFSLLLVHIQRVRLIKSTLISAGRMSIQLFLVAFVLTYLFASKEWYLIVIVYFVMVFFGAQTISGRVAISMRGLFGFTLISLLVSSGSVMAVFTFLVLRPEPWYIPQYFIPLVGMIIGNSMNGTALAFERYHDEVHKSRKKIETLLSFGATAAEASEAARTKAIQACLLPTISSMTGMGLVWLPGMMTGQILGGSPPMLAIKYQIAIMLAIFCSVTISSMIILRLARGRLFNPHHLLVIDSE